jgi:hypothetical protein
MGADVENQEFQKVTRTDLVRDSGEVFDNLLRGRAVLVEKHGKPQAVLMDIYDFYGLRAAAYYGIQEEKMSPEDLDAFVKNGPEEEEVHVKVIGEYLAEGITLEKAAALLGITSLELKSRFIRLQLPVREGEDDGEDSQGQGRPRHHC